MAVDLKYQQPLVDCIFSNGITRECFNAVGKFSEQSEAFTTCVIAGKIVGEIDWRMVVRIVSREPAV